MIRANPDSFRLALPWAVASFIGLIVLGRWAAPGDPFAFSVGSALVPALWGFLAASLIALVSTTRWGWWRYPLVACGMAAVVGLLMSMENIRDRRAADAADRSAPDMFAFKGVRGDWTRFDDPKLNFAIGTAAVEMEERIGAEVVVGSYLHGTGNETALIFYGVNGNPELTEPETAAGDILKESQAREVGTFDTAGLDGVLQCGLAAADAQPLCVHATTGSLAILQWDAPTLSVEEAASLSVDFLPLTLE